MKPYLLICILAWAPTWHLFAEDTNPQTLTLTIDSVTPDGKITVGIHNRTSKETSIWVGPYSWAWSNWRVFVLRKDETRLYCGYPNEEFTMNIPANIKIKPGSTFSETLLLGTEDWKRSDDPSNSETKPLMLWQGLKDTNPILQKGDKIIVLYDARWSMESNQYDVWTGVTSVTKDYLSK